MRHFYQQVFADPMTMHFYGECPLCGSRKYAGKIPFLCRRRSLLPQLEAGQGSPPKQMIYNHRKAATVQHLAKYFNLSRKHAMWICDQCFNPEWEEECEEED